MCSCVVSSSAVICIISYSVWLASASASVLSVGVSMHILCPIYASRRRLSALFFSALSVIFSFWLLVCMHILFETHGTCDELGRAQS